MKKFLGVGLVLVASGCAMTYQRPITTEVVYAKQLHASKQAILKVAKRVLISEGYQLTYADDESGVVSTSPRNFRLTPEQADCGTTMGIDYLKDKRTSTRVGYGVSVKDGSITIKANIESEYKPGDTMQNITLSCVSRGPLEADMFSKIEASLAVP